MFYLLYCKMKFSDFLYIYVYIKKDICNFFFYKYLLFVMGNNFRLIIFIECGR